MNGTFRRGKNKQRETYMKWILNRNKNKYMDEYMREQKDFMKNRSNILKT